MPASISHQRPSLRVLCTTQPGAGHLLPMVGLLRELRRRGHQVRIASAASLAGLAAAYGLELVPAGPDFRVGDEPRLVPELRSARARGLADFPYTRKVLVETLARAALPDIVGLVNEWRPDVIVRDPVEFAGVAAAEAAGVPHVTGRENRFLPPDVWQSQAGESLTALGRAAGTADLAAGSLYRYLGLAPALPTFVTATTRLPDPREFGTHVAPTVRFIRPRTPRRLASGPSGPAGRYPGRGAVLISFGTVYGSADDLRVAAAAVRGLARPVIWAGPLPEGAAQGPPGRAWLEFDDILPHCAAVVTVGGFGTVMAALRYGIPVVVVPRGADHATNAARCAALGAGVAVQSRQLSAVALRAAIDRVLDDLAFTARAAELAAEWAALPDADWAASQVEELAWSGRSG